MYEVGDTVEWRYYNGPEGRFYGPYHTGQILQVIPGHLIGRSVRPYLVTGSITETWIANKEIHQLIRKGRQNDL